MKERYKVIIVGMGSGGMYSADELVKNGIKDILLLDMGKEMEKRK